MNEDELRELLRQRAGSVRRDLDVPPSMLRRARTRMAFTAVSGALMVCLLGFGLFVGVRVVQGLRGETPAVTGAACTAAQLRGVASSNGIAGSRQVTVRLSNVSSSPCTLQGYPTSIAVLTPTGSQGLGSPIHAGTATAVTLAPSKAAQVRVRFACSSGPITGISLVLADGSTVRVPVSASCLAAGSGGPPQSWPFQPTG